MANRRMIAKSITESDMFLDLPLSSQALYFHLNMSADDDGFVSSPKSIARKIGAREDDLRLLILRKFIIAFESGVIVIKHWRINNYIPKDRYNKTNYTDEYALLKLKDNNGYSLIEGIPLIDIDIVFK